MMPAASIPTVVRTRPRGPWLPCLVATTALAACTPPAPAAEAEGNATTVRIQTVGRADIDEVLTYVADLQPYAEVRLYSPLADRILSFPWEDGDEIRRGQRVALIRKEGLDKGVEQMAAQVDGLDAQLRHLEGELARSKDLLAAGVITRQTFDQVQASYESTKAQRRALEASRAQLEVSAGNAVITAPISGVIAEKALQVGDMASPQVPLCRILTIDRLEAVLRLVEADVPRVTLGQPVRLHLDAFPDRTFDGAVTAILPYLDPATRTNGVKVTLDNPIDPATGKRLLKPGMFGRAEILLGRKEQVVVAPEHALLLDNQILSAQKSAERLRKAFVVDADGIAHRRVVRLGARSGSQVEILDGLSSGERLVVRGHHGLKDGATVKIVGEESPATEDSGEEPGTDPATGSTSTGEAPRAEAP